MGHGWLQAWEGREDVLGVLTGSYFFLQQRLWRPPQSGSEAPTGSTISRWFSSHFDNLFSLFCPHVIITYLLHIDCQIWGLWRGKIMSLYCWLTYIAMNKVSLPFKLVVLGRSIHKVYCVWGNKFNWFSIPIQLLFFLRLFLHRHFIFNVVLNWRTLFAEEFPS